MESSRSILLVLLLCCTLFVTAQDDDDQKKKTIVLELDTTQFYSNAFLLSELAEINDCREEDVPKLYAALLGYSLEYYEYDQYTYTLLPIKVKDSIRLEQTYRTVQSWTKDDYLGIIPATKDQKALQSAIQSQRADYVLSINLYEILTLSDSLSMNQQVLHTIHFDLLDRNLKLIHSGRYETETNFYSAYGMEWFYDDFALDLIFWIKTKESGNPDVFGQYQKEIDTYFRKLHTLEGKHGVGLLGGMGLAYGGIGMEYSYVLSNRLEWNAGAGFDFSGFKLGGGIRYYPTGRQNAKVNPFAGMSLALATGNKVTLGEEKDEFGTVLNPQEVSRYQIYGDQAVFLSTGLSIISSDGLVIMPRVSFAFPFNRKLPELLSGPEKEGRTNFMRFNAVGGLGFGIAAIFFFN